MNVDGSEVDLDLLPALSVLLEERNVTWAAQRLAVSQSALSAKLARLRRAMNDPLLVPAVEGRGMVLTPRAAGLQAPLAAALAALRQAISSPTPFEPVQSRRTFRLAMKDHAAVTLGGNLAQAVMREGGTQIRLAFMPPGPTIEEQLEDGTTDILIGTEKSVRELFMQRVLSRKPYRTAQRKDHPRGTDALQIDEFCALAHMVVPGEQSGFGCPVDAALERAGRGRRIAVSVDSLAAVPGLLSKTDLVCTLPYPFLALFERDIDNFKPPVELGDYVLLAFWHPRNQADPGHIWLRHLLFEAAGEPSASD